MMMIKAIRVMLFLAVVMALLLVNPGRAYACFCVPRGSPAEELAKSTAVFTGRVVSIESSSAPLWRDVDSVNVTFRVSEVWKGPRRGKLTVLTARHGIDCGYEFESGKEYLVYAAGAENRLVVWFCSRTQPLAEAREDLAVLGAGRAPLEAFGDVGVEVHASPDLPGKREASQSFAYFVPWGWLTEEGRLSKEHVGFAFWNDPEKAPIVSPLLWHGSVYGGRVTEDIKLALVEKIGNDARMTGPWEFGASGPLRVGVDDEPLAAEMKASQVFIRQAGYPSTSGVTKYTVRAGDTLSEIAGKFGTSVGAIAQANNIADRTLIFTGQILVVPIASAQ
ncbi:MAG: putative cell wall hydrolase LytN [Anaerolineales bacterium]|nr:putative cell wall hydrolase LytN [Anaerolineales bacterium]